jgi:hypothetical protein
MTWPRHHEAMVALVRNEIPKFVFSKTLVF